MEKKANYWASITYVVMLALLIPFSAICAGVFPSADTNNHSGPALWEFPILLYLILLAVLGVFIILQSFRMSAQNCTEFCVNNALICKLGILPFCAIFLLVIFIFISFGAVAALFSGSMDLLAGGDGQSSFPFSWLSSILLPSLAVSWLFTLPGSFYGLQVARLTGRAGLISPAGVVLHSLLQFFFVVGLLDALYLSAKKWRMHRNLALTVAIVALIGLVALLFGVVKICIFPSQ